MKKFLSILLAAMMVLAMTAAYAANHTIQVAADDERTYEILQIFTGDYSDGVLSNVKWGKNGTGETGSAVDEDLITALSAYNTNSYNDAQRLEAILTYVNSSEDAYATVTTGNPASVPAGYYLMREVIEEIPDNYVVSLFVVEVADDVTITPKAGTVEFNKKIKDLNDSTGEESGWQDSADYDIGDEVPFRLYGKLPANFNKFDTYYLKFTDEMEDSLTFNNDAKVYVDGNEVTTGFVVTPDADNHGFTVEFANVKNITGAGNNSEITVEFTATLNENAVIGNQGNMNKANMTYTNNSNGDGTGTATTDDDAVIAFTYKYVVNKVDQNGDPLKGAEFTLEKYNQTENKWDAIEVVKNDEGTVFTFEGLDDGKYRLTETTTPAGYNTIAVVTFNVTAGHTTDVEMSEFTYNGRTAILTSLNGTVDGLSEGEAAFTPDLTQGALSSDVENKSGATLPETGGIGTTLFYLIGGLMAAGSALTLVIRRRADADEE